MTDEEIITLLNKHVEGCGEPPSIDFESYDYVSYFENKHGEQSLFLFNKETDRVIVYIADGGWENPISLPSSELIGNNSQDQIEAPGIVPSPEEIKWLRACKSAIKPRLEYLSDKDDS